MTPPPPLSASLLPSSRPSTVLVVDDTPANLGVVLDTLASAHLRVLLAESGERALALAARSVPDLVLLDVAMPDLDGFATLARLRTLPGCAHTPVIFLTAHGEPGHIARAFAAGAVDYVTKPAHPPEVLARTQVQLELLAARRQLEQHVAALAAAMELRLDVEAQLAGSLQHALLLASAAGEILFETRLAAELVCRHFPDTPAGRLPAALDVPHGSLVAGRLRVARLASGGRAGASMFLLEEETPAPTAATLLSLGLTPRQAEVLFWVAQGKTNAEVAAILGASPRTVEKHMENIFERLGCEHRAAALAVALPLLQPRTPASGP